MLVRKMVSAFRAVGALVLETSPCDKIQLLTKRRIRYIVFGPSFYNCLINDILNENRYTKTKFGPEYILLQTQGWNLQMRTVASLLFWSFKIIIRWYFIAFHISCHSRSLYCIIVCCNTILTKCAPFSRSQLN